MNKLDELINQLCPDGVEYKTLGELGNFLGGLTGKSKDDFKDGNAKFITYRNVYSNPALRLDVDERVLIHEGEKQRTLEYGDILFTGSSETPDECGLSSVLTTRTDEKLYLNSFCFIFRIHDLKPFNLDFLKHLFRSDKVRYQIQKTASGVTRFNVSKKLMRNVRIPIPPIDVQDEIVRILDVYAELVEALKADLATELTYREKQYNHYIRELLLFSNDIPKKKLGDIVNFKNGKGHEKDIVSSGKYIVVNSRFISTNGSVKKYSNKQICPLYSDDILMVMSDLPNGRALARCFLVDADDLYTLNQRIGCFHVLDESITRTKFLYFVLNRNPQLLQYDNGVDQTNLKKGEILDIDIPIPDVGTQDRIICSLEKLSALFEGITTELPIEIDARKKQYEFYRDKLLTFKEKTIS